MWSRAMLMLGKGVQLLAIMAHEHDGMAKMLWATPFGSSFDDAEGQSFNPLLRLAPPTVEVTVPSFDTSP